MVPTVSATKYQLVYLAEKSKAMKQNLHKHSDALVEAHVKRVQAYQQENRSALRKVVVYVKQPNLKELAKNVETKTNAAKNTGQNQLVLHY